MPDKSSSTSNDRPERVFLIDSMSHIFRAFYAPMQNRVAPLATSHGQVTQAVYIFTNMLIKLLREEKPDYIAAIFESKEKTFRHETFADYKANREAMPEDLATQLPYIIRLCEAFNIPVINSPGYEADDVIGTLAKQIAEQKLQVVIVSNDKDMCQLVRDPFIICMRQNSQVLKRKEPVPPIEWCNEEWVEKKFGVTADKLVDLLGLMGDSVDNIPGAPGIGSKGAVQIIQQFGSIEAALAGWESVKHKTYRESLRDNAALIRQSRELARIQQDIDVPLKLDEIKSRPPDRSATYQLFNELEFAALSREYADAAEVKAATVETQRDYRLIQTKSALDNLVRTLFDAETIGIAIADTTPAAEGQQECFTELETSQGIAFSTKAGSAAYVDLEKFSGGNAIETLREVFSNGLIEKSVHDLKRATALLASSPRTSAAPRASRISTCGMPPKPTKRFRMRSSKLSATSPRTAMHGPSKSGSHGFSSTAAWIDARPAHDANAGLRPLTTSAHATKRACPLAVSPNSILRRSCSPASAGRASRRPLIAWTAGSARSSCCATTGTARPGRSAR